jgi:hypothetical protein
MIDTNKASISLIAGPTELTRPLFSYDLNEACEYQPIDIVQVLCNHPDISEYGSVHAPDSWKAIFTHEDITFDIRLSVYEDRTAVFCGFEFSGRCRVIDLVRLRQYMYHNGFESLWFHDKDCEIMDPVGFARKYAKKS